MKWRRPYSGGPYRLLAGSFLVFQIAFFIWVVVLIFAGSDRLGRKVGALVGVVLFATVSLTFMWRVFRVGVLVSEVGIRVRGSLRTVTVQWPDVDAIRMAPFKLPSLLFWMRFPPEFQAIWIDRRDGPSIQTALGTVVSDDKSAQFLGRRREVERAFRSLQRELGERKDVPESGP
jgi:hypothetical protein